MKFSLAIYASPDLASTALGFAEALVDQGHEIYRLFFFNEGVLNGAALPQAKSAGASSSSPLERWQGLIQKHELDAVVCVTSAQKRGIVPGDANQNSAGANYLSVAEGFTIGGLGQLIDATVNSDRIITFGN